MRMKWKLAVAALAAMGASSCATVPGAGGLTSAACDDNCLYQMAGHYMDSLAVQYIESAPLAADIRMTENGVDVQPGEGIWSTAKGWSYRHTFVDPQQGGVGIFGVIREESGKDAIVAFRLKQKDGFFTESEALIIHEGDFPLFQTDHKRPREGFYRHVPEDKRSSREELKAIALGYFEGLSNGDPGDLKFHPDCDRQENGFRTTNNPPRIIFSCRDLYPFSYMASFRTPDYPVIDEERGLVLGVTAFDMPEATRDVEIRGRTFNINPERQRLPRTLFLYELFKVEDGQIMMIDAVLMNFEYNAQMGWGER